MTLVRFPNHADEALSGLLATVLDAVVVINETGAIVGWNSVAETTFGWTASEVDGEIMGNLIVPVQYRAAHHAGMVRFIESGEAHVLNRRIELSAINKAGREFPVELSIVPMVAGGDRLFVGFLRDISIRREADEKLALSEATVRLATEAAEIGTWDLDLATDTLVWSDRTKGCSAFPLAAHAACKTSTLAYILTIMPPQ